MSLGSLTGMEDIACRMVHEAEEEYRRFVDMHRSRLVGKRVMLIGSMVSNFDWIIDLLRDVGADIVRVAFISGGRKRRSEPVTRYPDLVAMDYTLEDLGHDLEELRPHLFIGDLPRSTVNGCRFARMTKMGFGVRASMAYIQYLENMLRLPDDEGWKGGKVV
jgi:nitrogenase molybdenum-iron protein alpha/beta subunit